MRIRLAVAVAAAALSLPTGATAGPPNDATYSGTCLLAAVAETSQLVQDPKQYNGVLGGVFAGYSPTLGHNAVDVTFICRLYVDSALVESITQNGSVVAAGARVVSYLAHQTSSVVVCTDVALLDAHGQPQSFSLGCGGVTAAEVAPEEVPDLLQPVCDLTLAFPCDALRATKARVHYYPS